MLNEDICKLRDKLNKSIENGADYSITYRLSVELDELIAKYYRDLKNRKKKLVVDRGQKYIVLYASFLIGR